MKTGLLITFLILIKSVGICQSIKGEEYISDKYLSGPYLIYDCREKNWACVSEQDFTECHSLRNKDLSNDLTFIHSCSPIGYFFNARACNQRILFLTTHQHGERFCVKEEWRGKNINF